jgi:hypothetical protein
MHKPHRKNKSSPRGKAADLTSAQQAAHHTRGGSASGWQVPTYSSQFYQSFAGSLPPSDNSRLGLGFDGIMKHESELRGVRAVSLRTSGAENPHSSR